MDSFPNRSSEQLFFCFFLCQKLLVEAEYINIWRMYMEVSVCDDVQCSDSLINSLKDVCARRSCMSRYCQMHMSSVAAVDNLLREVLWITTTLEIMETLFKRNLTPLSFKIEIQRALRAVDWLVNNLVPYWDTLLEPTSVSGL